MVYAVALVLALLAGAANASIIAMAYDEDSDVLTALTDIQCEIGKGTFAVSKVRGVDAWALGCWKGNGININIEYWDGTEKTIPAENFRIVDEEGQPIDTAIHSTV